MKTYREIMYMIFDLLKIGDLDESQFTEGHLIDLIDYHRALILKQRYTDVTKSVSMANYQTLTFQVDYKDNPDFAFYSGEDVLPSIMPIGVIRTWDSAEYRGYNSVKIHNHVPYNRFRFITQNKYNKNQEYTSINDEGKGCYLGNRIPGDYTGGSLIPPIAMGKTKAMSAVYESAKEVYLYNGVLDKDLIDCGVPIEERLIKDLISSISAILKESLYLPKDEFNNDRNDLDNIPTGK